MKINEIFCKSILAKSSIPGAEFCINPYVGCSHGCVYCYARFMKRFTNHSEEWGSFVDVKVNGPEILRKRLRRKVAGERILLSSVTDPYQPVESKYRITRQILEILSHYPFKISILTKSHLVADDVDVLKKIKNLEVGMSINSVDDEFRKVVDPFASSVEKKLKALETLKAARIHTWVFISPVFPRFTKVDEIIKKLAGKVDSVMGEALNFKCGNRKHVEKAIGEAYPLEIQGFLCDVNKYRVWKGFDTDMAESCAKQGVEFSGFFYH